MQFRSLPLVLLVAVLSVQARPTGFSSRRAIFDSVTPIDDALVFDGAAFPDPTNPGNTLVGLQSFVSLRQIDLGPLTSGLEAALKGLGVDVGDKISTVEDRIKLFGAIGLSGKTVKVDVDGCSQQAELAGTSGLPDLGMVLRNVSLGQCGGAKELNAQVSLSGIDSRKIQATVFNSPNSGFGVISDIDDTVKISNVLDKIELAKTTLLDDPQPVPGMPQLYASLAKSLNSPQFIYVSGSPFQLYPFLNDFIDTTYSASKGPILLQNLTLVDVQGLLDFANSNGVFEYKLSMIDRIQGMYPNKKFVAIGDSTQKDPETYGEAFRKFGNFITCSWIRKVDGADNSDARFAAAFKGVPANKFRVFEDKDIAGLANINVAGGEC